MHLQLAIQRPIRINPDCFERCSDSFLSIYRRVQNNPSSYASCLQKIISMVTLVVSSPFTLIGAFFAWLSKTRKTVEEIGPCSKLKAFQQLLLARTHSHLQYQIIASIYLNQGLKAHMERTMDFKVALTDFDSISLYFMNECAEMEYTQEEIFQRISAFITQFPQQYAQSLQQNFMMLYLKTQEAFRSANNPEEVKNNFKEIYRNWVSQRRVPYPVPRERPPAIKINPEEIRKKIDEYGTVLGSKKEMEEFNNQIKAYMKSQGNEYEIHSEDDEEMQVISATSYLQVEKNLMGYSKDLFLKRVYQFSFAEKFSEKFTDLVIKRLKPFFPKEEKSVFQRVLNITRRTFGNWNLSPML